MIMAIERKFIEDSLLRYKITEYMKNALSNAGFSGLTIQKTPLITLINAEVTNPGRIIGRRGKTINDITEALKVEFGLENPKINISSVNEPNLEPLVVANKLVRLIEMGKNPRRMMHSMAKSIMDAGAIGTEIVVGGKLSAKGGRSRSFRTILGYLPKAGEPTRLVKKAHVTAYTKGGAIGILVQIAPRGVQFPDKKSTHLPVPEKKEEIKVQEPRKVEEPRQEKKVEEKKETPNKKVEHKKEVKDKPKSKGKPKTQSKDKEKDKKSSSKKK
jgi:small subunit ribosomal protein S3